MTRDHSYENLSAEEDSKPNQFSDLFNMLSNFGDSVKNPDKSIQNSELVDRRNHEPKKTRNQASTQTSEQNAAMYLSLTQKRPKRSRLMSRAARFNGAKIART